MAHHSTRNLLDSFEAVLGFAKNMTWKGKNPIVKNYFIRVA